MTLALIMSGGGARGAYEVGVLSYLYSELAEQHGDPPIELICGTSVGAINGAFLAANLHDPKPGLALLRSLWSDLTLANVLGFNVLQATRLHRMVLGGRRGSGLFDATPLTAIIRTGVDYGQLRRNLKEHRLRALTVTATHVGTGKPVCFVHRAPGVELPVGLPHEVRVRAAQIMPHHVLASAAIPVVFPPVFIRKELYADGGLRLNTPLSPAIHLGASKVLVIGLSTDSETSTNLQAGRFPGLPFLLGKVLDAFLLDHVNLDLAELDRVNHTLEDGITAFGPDFLERLNAAAAARGAPPRRIITSFTIRPSVDLGVVALNFLRRERVALKQQLGRTLLRLIDVGEGAQAADLASYLLFDGDFATELINLGRRDAAARHDELRDFLYGAIPNPGDNRGQIVDSRL